MNERFNEQVFLLVTGLPVFEELVLIKSLELLDVVLIGFCLCRHPNLPLDIFNQCRVKPKALLDEIDIFRGKCTLTKSVLSGLVDDTFFTH